MSRTPPLAALDHAHVWHPFTPMKQWQQREPLIIDAAEGFHLIDTRGHRYLDGVSSLWCNVHGHRVPRIDAAIRAQLDRVAHSTLLGLASTPSIELAAKLVKMASPIEPRPSNLAPLTRVFYSDSGSTALEVAFKMAVGYWHHTGYPAKNRFIGLEGAYHGDTTGSMSVGYAELFHKPYLSMIFPVTTFPAPRCTTPSRPDLWPSEDPDGCAAAMQSSLDALQRLLREHAHETAAIVIEPVMQGAAGMIPQPRGFVHRVAQLAREHNVLLIADEVATGFGRTGSMLACHQEHVTPDILCLAKGITGGYLPLAATLTHDRLFNAFCGEIDERRTLYHGHTYTGNALACAAAIASLDLFHEHRILDHAKVSAALIQGRLHALRGRASIRDVRQRGLMVGMELAPGHSAAELCLALRDDGVILRPLGNVVVLMPAPAMPHDLLEELLHRVIRRCPGE